MQSKFKVMAWEVGRLGMSKPITERVGVASGPSRKQKGWDGAQVP